MNHLSGFCLSRIIYDDEAVRGVIESKRGMRSRFENALVILFVTRQSRKAIRSGDYS
jgi:hypothetical protein